jgi:hypothetical protein
MKTAARQAVQRGNKLSLQGEGQFQYSDSGLRKKERGGLNLASAAPTGDRGCRPAG